MPDVNITIGGRTFAVACQDGEEAFLHAAASLLDKEAQALADMGARLTQDRMLLMAGLMLADKTIGVQEEQRALEGKLAAQAAVIDELQDRALEASTPVPTVPEGLEDRLAPHSRGILINVGYYHVTEHLVGQSHSV